MPRDGLSSVRSTDLIWRSDQDLRQLERALSDLDGGLSSAVGWLRYAEERAGDSWDRRRLSHGVAERDGHRRDSVLQGCPARGSFAFVPLGTCGSSPARLGPSTPVPRLHQRALVRAGRSTALCRRTPRPDHIGSWIPGVDASRTADRRPVHAGNGATPAPTRHDGTSQRRNARHQVLRGPSTTISPDSMRNDARTLGGSSALPGRWVGPPIFSRSISRSSGRTS